MAESGLTLKRWTRVEYERLIDRGAFMPDDRIELIDGLLVVAEPQSAYHYTAIGLVVRALTRAFGEGWTIRSQGPIALDESSEPEPDVAVVRGDLADYAAAHPTDPVLVVEVTLTNPAMDRRYKSSLYARAGRPEYWLLNLVDTQLEVYRDPSPAGYASRCVLKAGDRVSPLHTPAASIPIDDLLP